MKSKTCLLTLTSSMDVTLNSYLEAFHLDLDVKIIVEGCLDNRR